MRIDFATIAPTPRESRGCRSTVLTQKAGSPGDGRTERGLRPPSLSDRSVPGSTSGGIEMDERRRQQALARKRAKQKSARAKQRTRQVGLGSLQGPVRECLRPVNLFDVGIGNLLIARDTASGEVEVGVFLGDMFSASCIGRLGRAPPTNTEIIYSDRLGDHPNDTLISERDSYNTLSYPAFLGIHDRTFCLTRRPLCRHPPQNINLC